jgi:glycosyltransferase involved in cell wall biosynthesis
MLEPWAMNHKRLKKRLAWRLYQRSDLKRACCHHTTAEMEASNVQRLGLGVPVRVIPNGIDLPQLDPNAPAKNARGEKKTALFLGRIYPVKGLPMLIEAWARVRPNDWQLQIAGPDEARHRAVVEKMVCAAGLNEVVSFLGPIDSQEKSGVFFNADLFVLPTYSESFGMAIAEALAHGLPVLTTTGAPWPMLTQRRCGLWIDPNVDGLAAGLRQLTSLDSATLQAMGARGRKLVAEEFGWDRIAEQFVAMYESLIACKAA